MLTADALGYVAYGLVFLGQLLIARRRSVGWVARAAGNAGWVAIGLYLGLYSIVVCETAFFVLDLYGYLNRDRTIR